MNRWIARCLALVLCLWAEAEPARADQVEGYVIDPTNNRRIGDIEIAFYIRQDEQVSEIMRKRADGEGRFRFSGPFLTAGTAFALAAFYKDVTYFSSTLEVGAQQQIILEVYEPTSQSEDLRITSHNLFLNVTQEQVEAVHLAQFFNAQESAYVGSGSGSERRVSEFRLPAGALDVQSHSGRMQQADETTFFDNQPLLPGHSQLSFSFIIDPEQLSDGYWHEAVYPTDRMELFVQPSTIEVGGEWIDNGVMDLHGQQYRRLQINGIAAGQRVHIPLPISTPNRWMLKWAALAIGALAGAAVWLLWSGTAAPTAPSAQDLERHRRQTLEEMARLDAEYAGRKDDAAYLKRRRELLDRAIDLTRRAER